jgi:hypothetical protein
MGMIQVNDMAALRRVREYGAHRTPVANRESGTSGMPPNTALHARAAAIMSGRCSR